MLTRRLQVLLDEPRQRRLEAEARRRGVSVATIVREAIDQALPVSAGARHDAARDILSAEPMAVPADPVDLKAELDGARR